MITRKQLFSKANELSQAVDKTVKGLAQDGLALDGFVELLRAKQAYDKAYGTWRFEMMLRKWKK